MPPAAAQLNIQAERLLEWIRNHARMARGRDLEKPLPTTRALGEKFSISNSTSFRMLELAEKEGLLWRKPNGRFYPRRAQSLLERPKPIACLFRQLQGWSAMSRGIMEGICDACGEAGTAVMLWPDANLVRHDNPALPPIIADARQQRTILETFLRRYGDTIGGIIWDHDWEDSVIEQLHLKIPSVMAGRRSELASVGSVSLDYVPASIESTGWLLARGYESIQLIEPFPNEPAIAQTLLAFEAALRKLSVKSASIHPVHSPEQRAKWITRLTKSDQRIALICPEDNVAVELQSLLRSQSIPVSRIGIFSAQGSALAIERNLTRLSCDYRKIGRGCIDQLRRQETTATLLPTTVIGGGSTS